MARLPLHRWRYSTRLLFSGCDQAIYQQDLVIHRTVGRDYEEEVGGLKVWHIFIGPTCRGDYGDIRFTNSTGAELAYYLWPDYDGESARICVRLEGADGSGGVTVHYGNPSAATTSDGDATYLLHDRFEGDTIDSNKWSVKGSVSANCTIEGSAWNAHGVSSAARFGNGVMAEIRHRCSSPSGLNVMIGFSSLDNYQTGKNLYYEGASSAHLWAGGKLASTSAGASHTKYGTSRIIRDQASFKVTTIGGMSLSTATLGGEFPVVVNVGSLTFEVDYILVRAYSSTPPALLRTSRGVNPAYAGLARLTGSAAADGGVIQFAGVGSIRVVGDERETFAGAGAFSIATSVRRSPITIAGAAGVGAGLNLMPAPATFVGAGVMASEPVRLRTPLDMESGEGLAYVAPTPVQFDLTKYRFSSLTISRSAQDALWQCEGRIVGLDAPLAYKQFEVRVPDHNGVLRTIFVGFVPGRDYVRAVAADESIIQGYDAGFYLTRQYLPDGDLNYPKEFAWGPMSLLRYWLGEETTTAGSRSRWEQVTDIYPYRLSNPHSYYEWPYDKRIDWNFMPKTTKAQAIQEVCEKSGLVFLVKWRKINGVWRPCAYLVPEEDIDHYSWGLDLPGPVTFTHPDPHVIDGVRVTMRSDEKYNRIVVRSAAPSGAWFEAIRETPGLRYGDELPIEYLEERGDLPDEADHGGWCNMRADDLYDYYTKYAYTYTLTLIDRVDLELYQRCQFFGFAEIPSGEMMRIVAITYNVLPTHTEVEITITPDSRLSDLRRLQRSQAADSVSEIQTIAQSQIDQVATGEVGTVVGVEGTEAIVEMERKAGTSIRGRIV